MDANSLIKLKHGKKIHNELWVPSSSDILKQNMNVFSHDKNLEHNISYLTYVQILQNLIKNLVPCRRIIVEIRLSYCHHVHIYPKQQNPVMGISDHLVTMKSEKT